MRSFYQQCGYNLLRVKVYVLDKEGDLRDDCEQYGDGYNLLRVEVYVLDKEGDLRDDCEHYGDD